MKAAVLIRKGEIRIEDRRMPTPAQGEVQIKVGAVGVCGSDVHYYSEGRIGNLVVREPIVLGHEFSGTVSATGPGAKAAKVGDRVVVEPGFPCGRCPTCYSGRYNLCPRLTFFGTPPIDGAYQEYVLVPERFVFAMPDGMTFEEGALAEPTAVAVQAVNRGGLKLGETAMVFGAGPIGLITMQAAFAAGASAVYISDVDSHRLRLASELGATVALDAKDDPVKALQELTGGRGVDVSFEAVGTEETLEQAVEVVAPGGRVVAIGLAPETHLRMPFFSMMEKEVNLLGVWRYCHAFPPAMALIARKQVRVAQLITHRFPLEKIEEAFVTMRERRGNAVKVVLML